MKTFEDATYSQKYGVGKIYANTLKCLLGGWEVDERATEIRMSEMRKVNQETYLIRLLRL